jgi:sporulation protein YlmC with PRC-barrel domain
MPRDDRLTMRDIVDGLLETTDGTNLGRVADVRIEIEANGTARLTDLMIGPEALAGRISSRLRPLAHWLLRGRFEHTIPVDEIDEFGPTLILRQEASHYDVGHPDEWVNRHILRFIPGSGTR